MIRIPITAENKIPTGIPTSREYNRCFPDRRLSLIRLESRHNGHDYPRLLDIEYASNPERKEDGLAQNKYKIV